MTVADKPAGRGQQLRESAVKETAKKAVIPILQPSSLKDETFLDALQAFNADVFVVVAFRMLPQVVWKMPPLGTINLHASLLPDYRGAAPINWAIINQMIDDNAWYLSDTNSYINYDYIISKGNDVYRGMCDIIGIDPLIPKLMNSNSGGAQSIVKNTTFEFWEKVENDSINLYKWFSEIEPNWDKEFYPIQKWTAGMWSLLWNSWYFGFETKISDKLDFCWSTDMIDIMEGKQFLHNAGVTADRQDLFFKGNYTHSLPYGLNLPISPLFVLS